MFVHDEMLKPLMPGRAFKVFADRSEIGAAGNAGGDHPKPLLSVRLEDPCLSEPLMAALFESTDGSKVQLMWKRRSPCII